MAKIGSFGKRRTLKVDDTIDFCGEEFTLRPLDGFTLMDFLTAMTEVQGSGDKATVGLTTLNSFNDVLRKAIVEYDRFREISAENAVELDELIEVASSIFEWASARPTSQQSAPSGLLAIDGMSANGTFSHVVQTQSGQDTSERPETPTDTGQNG